MSFFINSPISPIGFTTHLTTPLIVGSKINMIDSITSSPVSIISTPYTDPVLAVTTKVDNLTSMYTFPLAPNLDLNRDPYVHDTVTDSIYKQIFREWVYESDFEGLFKYIKIVNGHPKLITKADKEGTNKKEDRDIKVRFMKDYILSRGRVKKLIEEFIDGTRTNWYDIEKNTYFVREFVYKYMKKKLKALVDKKADL